LHHATAARTDRIARVSNRQKIGLRKAPLATRKRGRERRKLLLKATYELLCAQPVEDISFRDIAEKAGVPEGSAYHFFANRFDLFSALAEELSEQFIEAHRRKVPPSRRKTWQALAEHFELPETDEMRKAFYYFIEITDLVFTLSVIEHGKITAAMLSEAKRAGIGYLSTYLE
jgi:AcrR family transcriptional regulator